MFIHELGELILTHEGKYRVIAEITLTKRPDRTPRQVAFACTHHQGRIQRADEFSLDLFFKTAWIALHTQYEAVSMNACS